MQNSFEKKPEAAKPQTIDIQRLAASLLQKTEILF